VVVLRLFPGKFKASEGGHLCDNAGIHNTDKH